MLAELSCIVQLQAVVQFAISISLIHTTRTRTPEHLLLIRRVLILVPAGVVADITRLRVDILIIRMVVRVIDTALSLPHRVVIRQTRREFQTLGHESQILLQDEVSRNLSVRGALVTRKRNVGHRVRLVGITGCIESVRAVAVDGPERVRSRAVDTAPESITAA